MGERSGAAPEGATTGRAVGSARRIVAATAAAVLVLVGLAWWALVAPVEAGVDGETVTCDDVAADARGAERSACDAAEDDRRTTALLVGAGVATVAAAISTWPSRRLTGEEPGPLR